MDPKRRRKLKSEATAFFDGVDYRVLSATSLGDRFGIRKKERDDLLDVLDELEDEGIVVHVDGRGWCSPRREGWIVGRLRVNRKGFGFVKPARDDSEGDLFVAGNRLKDGHDGDLVLVKLKKPRRGARPGSREGRIISVLRRSDRVLVGIYYEGPGEGGVVEPIGAEGLREIFIPRGKELGVEHGDRVLVRRVEGQSVGGLPPGEVVERAAPEGSWAFDLQRVVAEFDLSEEFPEEAEAEARQLGDRVPEAEVARRTDVRGRSIMTIDPRDAKDFDDAVILERDESTGAWHVGVFVADVSHYVRPGMAIDREAYRRGTSVYLPGRVFPMLPESLSNRLCSLQEGEDRLAKAVWMVLSPEGELQEMTAERVVMRSRRRFAYHEVQELLDGAPPESGEEDLVAMLRQMDELRELLHERRRQRGALDLDLPEQRILLDDDGEVTEIGVHERLNAHRIVEEFMLLANEAVARLATRHEISILRRAHAAPPGEDVQKFLKFCRIMTPKIPVKSERDFQPLVEALRGRPEAAVMNLALLRTLTRAEYSPRASRHHALALDQYCHFTSPIRRYPDLQVHRALDARLFDDAPRLPAKLELPGLELMAEHCSVTERQAEDAERELAKLRVISWLRPLEGERFTGIITAVLDYGFFVRLDTNLAEGMVHISSLRDDYYVLQESQFALRGRHTGRSFALGDPIEVTLYRADAVSRQIDFRYVRHRG